MRVIYLASSLLGKLSLKALPHDPITAFGASLIVLVPILLGALITWKKKWKWLYKEWLTTQDHKKIGIMYIIVAVAMAEWWLIIQVVKSP